MTQKPESRLPGEISYLDIRYADRSLLTAQSEEELKSLLMKVKEENEKAGLKLNIQKTNIMASSLITSWQIEGETVSDFMFLGSKITADGDCSHKIKRCFLLGRKVMTNLWSVSHLVVSDSLQPHGLYSPWNSPDQNTGVGSLSLLQGIFPTQGTNPGLLLCRQILYQLSHKGSPWQS